MAKTKNKIKDYHYKECGLDNIIIRDMPVIIDDAGDEIIEIPMINALHASIVYELISKEAGLQAEELRFIRTEMGLTQSELAERIKKDHQTIGRWERAEHPIDPTAEVLIRMLALEHLVGIGYLQKEKDCLPSMSIDELSKKCVPAANEKPIEIKLGKNGYERVAA